MKPHILSARTVPSQKRAGQTLAAILDAAASLLEEDGFEELTTNKICEQAGVTPPALYRYFPNKYAVVCELARRLMEAQNTGLLQWAEELGERKPRPGDIFTLLASQVDITRKHAAGSAIMRTLYATPQLAGIRIGSHEEMVGALSNSNNWIAQRLSGDALYHRMRLAVEIGNSVIEMVLENPDIDEKAIIEDAAEMLSNYLTK